MTTGLSRAAAHRIACAIVAVEVRRLRPSQEPLSPTGDWPEDTPIGDRGLGLDSLEQVGALGALADSFHLDDRCLGPTPPATVGDWVDWVMRARVAGEERITVWTSGSTGDAKPCVHDMADLLGEAEFLASRLPGYRRLVSLVPAHHLYGMIWTALLPAALGVPVVPGTLGAALNLRSGDLLVAVPEQWQAILRLNRTLTGGVVGVSSAGTLNDDLALGLLGAGLARLIDVYGSSETGAIAMRDAPEPFYELLPRWTLASGSGDDDVLVDRGGRSVPLPDRIERRGERAIRPTGRRDGAVQVGGHNVWPARVATLLCDLAGVAEASVRLGANGRLKAYVVPHAGADQADLQRALERLVEQRLSEPERPRSFRFGSALPRNMMGKLEDWT